MNTDLRMTTEGGYVRITVSSNDAITLEDLSNWTKLLDACRKQGCNVALVEAPRMSLQMWRGGGFELAHALFQLRCRGLRIAFSVSEYDVDGASGSFTDIAEYGESNVAFFQDREEAFRWLGVGRWNGRDRRSPAIRLAKQQAGLFDRVDEPPCNQLLP